MSMYCMQCSALGIAPLTVACNCGSVRWRGTYKLPSPVASTVTITNRSGTHVKAELDPNGDRQVLEMVDAIRRMIAEGRVDVAGIERAARQD